MAEFKTNVMRILDKNKIQYKYYSYENDGQTAVDGVTCANKIGKPVEQVYKTLVTYGKSGNYIVFVIPVQAELDLKKAAKAVGEKSVEMIHVKDINKLTGYIRGGCSPIGMKKQFKTVIDCSAENLNTMIYSAGKIGYQIETAPIDLKNLIRAEFNSVCIEG